jgi:hypothetical protein
MSALAAGAKILGALGGSGGAATSGLNDYSTSGNAGQMSNAGITFGKPKAAATIDSAAQIVVIVGVVLVALVYFRGRK